MARWKKTGELTKFQKKLTDGMLSRGYDKEFAERIYQQICGFGEYGFPESHSASFAVLAYVSAWLKHYYPEAFYCGLLNSLPMGFYSASQLIQDAQRHQVIIKPVCINQSDWDHKLEYINQKAGLRLGFRVVKGLRQVTVDKLLAFRQQQAFSHVSQLKQLHISSNELQALASSDCLKAIAGDRYQSRWAMMDTEHELPLFADVAEPEKNYSVHPSAYENLIEDYASTGISLSQHPISLLREAGQVGRYTPASELIHVKHKTPVTVVGIVTGRQSPGTASGVTFVTLEDDTGNTNVVVWVATARAQKQSFLTSKVLMVKGILEKEQQVTHVIAGKLIDLTDKFANLEVASRDFH